MRSESPPAPMPTGLTLLYVWSFLTLVWMGDFHPLTLGILPFALLALWKQQRWLPSKAGIAVAVGTALAFAFAVSRLLHSPGRFLGPGVFAFALSLGWILCLCCLAKKNEATHLSVHAMSGMVLVVCSMSTDMKSVVVCGTIGVVLLALALRSGQSLGASSAQIAPMLAVLVLTACLGTVASWSETRLGYLLNLFALVPPSGVSFSTSSKLNSIQRWSSSDLVVFRAHGESVPLYLVGRTFTNYEDIKSFWKWGPSKEEVHSATTIDVSTPEGPMPLPFYPNSSLDLKEHGPPVAIEFPAGGSGFTCYVPRNFFGLAIELERMHHYSDGLWQVLALDSFSGTYYLFPYKDGWKEHGTPKPLSDADRTASLQLPENLPPVVSRLGAEVAGKYSSPKQKTQAVTTFLQTQFKYGYDYPFESDETALEEFLTKRPAAHCEFFATAAALMLRSQGVPTRYINGFVVQEKSYNDDYYVVRLKHAHAWFEAYLPDEGWTTFDPTPPGTLDDPETKAPTLSGMMEAAANAWRRFVAFISLSPAKMIARAREFVATRTAKDWTALVGFLVLIVGLRYWWWRRRRGPAKPRKTTLSYAAGHHEEWTPRFELLQEKIHPAHWRRQDWETPEQWLQRIAESNLEAGSLRAVTDVVRRYQSVRYGEGKALDPDSERALSADLRGLQPIFEGKSLEPRERPDPNAP